MAKQPKLCEIIAVASGKKSVVEKSLTDTYHKFAKPELFSGLQRTYEPIEEGGEMQPPEKKEPQLRALDLLVKSVQELAELWNITFTLDNGNCHAKADIVVDGVVVMSDVPVTSLLFLEKQMENVRSVIMKMPMPDSAERWMHDSSQDMLATVPKKTSRTKKIQKPLVLYPATPEHPAQTQLIQEDILAGYWTMTSFSTCVPASVRNAMLVRADKLLDAIKMARERANQLEVQKSTSADKLLGFVFGTLR